MSDISWTIAETFDASAGVSILGSALSTSSFGSVWENAGGSDVTDVKGLGDGRAQFYHPTSGGPLQVRLSDLATLSTQRYKYDSFHITATFDLTGLATPDTAIHMNVDDEATDVWVHFGMPPSGDPPLRVIAQKTTDATTIVNVTGAVHTLKLDYVGGVLTYSYDSTVVATESIATILIPAQNGAHTTYLLRLLGRDLDKITDFSMTAAATFLPDELPIGDWHIRDEFLDTTAMVAEDHTPNFIEGTAVAFAPVWVGDSVLPDDPEASNGFGFILWNDGFCYVKGAGT